MNEFDVCREQIFQAEAIYGMCVSTAHLHDAVMTIQVGEPPDLPFVCAHDHIAKRAHRVVHTAQPRLLSRRAGYNHAELGAMRMREEVDALRTMGFDPVEVLILPRIIALIIAVPILTFLGSMAALYGGGLVSWLYGGIQPEVFLARLREAVTSTTFEVGMIKAPFMALVIGIVACVEGLQVQGSAESLGEKTTNSVVKSIFLVIVLDGMFAMFFASIGM